MNWRGPAFLLAWLWWGELGLTSAHAEAPASPAAATPSTNDTPPVGTALERQLKRWLGAPQLMGQGTLRYFGFSIYQAQLWVGCDEGGKYVSGVMPVEHRTIKHCCCFYCLMCRKKVLSG